MTSRRHIFTPDQAARLLAAIGNGRLPIGLEESMDLDGDLVLAADEFRQCLEVAEGGSPRRQKGGCAPVSYPPL